MKGRDPREYRNTHHHTEKLYGDRTVTALCQREHSDAPGAWATHEASWLPLGSCLVVCFCNASLRGKGDDSLSRAPLNTQHTPFSTQGCALSTSYTLTCKSIFELGEEIMQKEFTFCYSFFSPGIRESKQKAMLQSRAKAVYLKRPNLKTKCGFYSCIGNVHWYFIHLFTQPVHLCLDSGWE